MNETPSAGGRLAGTLLGRLVFALPLFSFLLCLGGAPLFDVDEGAFSEATREMFERGDFLFTYLNGAPRFDKPIFIYWLQAIGYLIFGAPSPLFWGVLTCFATIIPIFGTALVWLPLAGYMALAGEWGPAVGLTLYGGLVVTHVDNVVRFVMQKKLADTHPLVTIFGVFIGLSLFGFMGVIFGPLLLEMFVFCVNIFKKRYLDGTPDKQLFVPGGAVRAHGPEAPAGRGVYEK